MNIGVHPVNIDSRSCNAWEQAMNIFNAKNVGPRNLSSNSRRLLPAAEEAPVVSQQAAPLPAPDSPEQVRAVKSAYPNHPCITGTHKIAGYTLS
jgi:hypothetical protein